MKTAEEIYEWLVKNKTKANKEFCVNNIIAIIGRDQIQVQLDAFKAGAKWAAGKVWDDNQPCYTDISAALRDKKYVILFTAEKLTELP